MAHNGWGWHAAEEGLRAGPHRTLVIQCVCVCELIDFCGKRCCTPEDISPFLNVPFYGEACRKRKKSSGVYENMRILVLLPENDKKKGKIEVKLISWLNRRCCRSFVKVYGRFVF